MRNRAGTWGAGALLVITASCQGAESTVPAGGEATGVTTAAITTAPPALDCTRVEKYEIHDVHGALFNTLAVDTALLPLADTGEVMANDQIHMLRMAADAGLTVRNKHIPAFVVFDEGGNPVSIQSGGFYQCATLADCQGYVTEVVGKYALDGVLFAQRAYFQGSFVAHAYEDIGAAEFQDIPADYAIKITRWSVPASVGDPRPLLAALWALFTREEACRRGTLAQAHLLWSAEERVVAEVTIGTKVTPAAGDPTPYYAETLAALAGQAVLDPLFDDLGWARVAPPLTDTYLVITYWPSWFGPSRWPNSASTTAGGPLPEPFCGDGSCNQTVADVETHGTCPEDCVPTCGNGVCDADESADTCAVDCGP